MLVSMTMEKRKAINAWDNYLESLVCGAQKASNVVSFSR